MKLLKKFFGFCDHCGEWFVYPKKRRMNTAYVDEESNYCYECKDCFAKTEEYWQERWDEYNAERY